MADESRPARLSRAARLSRELNDARAKLAELVATDDREIMNGHLARHGLRLVEVKAEPAKPVSPPLSKAQAWVAVEYRRHRKP